MVTRRTAGQCLFPGRGEGGEKGRERSAGPALASHEPWAAMVQSAVACTVLMQRPMHVRFLRALLPGPWL